MKADLRISIKDYHRNKNLKILLFRPPFPDTDFTDLHGGGWRGVGPVCLTRLLTGLRKSLVRSGQQPGTWAG
jgi:hypothetical protein